jgi:hypothetical protein
MVNAAAKYPKCSSTSGIRGSGTNESGTRIMLDMHPYTTLRAPKVPRGASRRAPTWPCPHGWRIALRVRQRCSDMPVASGRPASRPIVAAACRVDWPYMLYIFSSAPGHIEIIYERCYLPQPRRSV